jgi:hypothetical protein
MFSLVYAISRRTPLSQKALKWVLQAQTRLNGKVSWSHDRINLAPLGGVSERPALTFPFVRIAPTRIGPYTAPEPFGDNVGGQPKPNALATGTTKVRSLWLAHIVAAFLRQVSEKFPEAVLELSDGCGGFVIPVGVRIQAGRFEINRELLNRERERVLEATADPQAAAPFVWAESRALQGEFLADMAMSEYREVSELSEIEWDDEAYLGATVGEVANAYVGRVLAEVAQVPA